MDTNRTAMGAATVWQDLPEGDSMQLAAVLSQIDTGTLVLPEFQRGYVWSRDQVRGLLRSMYLGYPVGGLLVWETQASASALRQETKDSESIRQLLLDGQQRITTLYGVIRGRAPQFFEGDPNFFKGLYFNVADESFEFYLQSKMSGDPLWIDVTELFQENGFDRNIKQLSERESFSTYMSRLWKLRGILDRQFHIETIVGQDKTTDVVVDIFNRVNSGGTKLSKGDLALAKVAAANPAVRQKLRTELARWKNAGYPFEMDWLLRNVTAVATGRAPFASLDSISSTQFDDALRRTVVYIDTILNLFADRLGLDHGRVLLSRYAIPVITRYLHLNEGNFPSIAERDRLLYWFVHAGMWGRFSGSTETKLAQDYERLNTSGLDGIIRGLALTRGGELRVNPEDFTGYSMGSRFYPMLYLLTRVHAARDFGSGLELRAQLLGKSSGLEVHHIFPKAVLYKAGYSRGEVNAIANFAFLTKSSNQSILAKEPAEYLAKIAQELPGVLESQWVPTDPELWRIDRYPDFLQERRRLLADAANHFLESLREGTLAAGGLHRLAPAVEFEPDESSVRIDQLVVKLRPFAVVDPLRDHPILDPTNDQLLAMADAWWPDGLQVGRGEPTGLILDPDGEDIERLQALGYRVFTSVAAITQYVRREASHDAGDETDNVA